MHKCEVILMMFSSFCVVMGICFSHISMLSAHILEAVLAVISETLVLEVTVAAIMRVIVVKVLFIIVVVREWRVVAVLLVVVEALLVRVIRVRVVLLVSKWFKNNYFRTATLTNQYYFSVHGLEITASEAVFLNNVAFGDRQWCKRNFQKHYYTIQGRPLRFDLTLRTFS